MGGKGADSREERGEGGPEFRSACALLRAGQGEAGLGKCTRDVR